MIDQGIRRRFEEMLPWYVNGTLERDSRQWFETQLSAHPELRSELELTEVMQTRIRASIPEVSPEIGLDTLMSRIHTERRTTATTTRSAKASDGGLMQKIGAFFESFRLTPAFATAAAVIAVQAGVIGMLLNEHVEDESEYSTFRSSGDGAVVTGPLIGVFFDADARERDIRAVLVEIGGVLTGGPGQLGQYLVYVPQARVADTIRILEASAIVESVEVIPDAPAGR